MGHDSQPSLAGSSRMPSVPLGSPVPHRKVLPGHTYCSMISSPGSAKSLPPASPVYHCPWTLPRRLQAGHPLLPAVTYCSNHFCPSLYSKPRSSRPFIFLFACPLSHLLGSRYTKLAGRLQLKEQFPQRCAGRLSASSARAPFQRPNSNTSSPPADMVSEVRTSCT